MNMLVAGRIRRIANDNRMEASCAVSTSNGLYEVAPYILDTGALICTMPKGRAERYGIYNKNVVNENVSLGGFGGAGIQGRLVKVDFVAIDCLVSKNVIFFVPSLDIPIVSVIGANVLNSISPIPIYDTGEIGLIRNTTSCITYYSEKWKCELTSSVLTQQEWEAQRKEEVKTKPEPEINPWEKWADIKEVSNVINKCAESEAYTMVLECRDAALRLASGINQKESNTMINDKEVQVPRLNQPRFKDVSVWCIDYLKKVIDRILEGGDVGIFSEYHPDASAENATNLIMGIMNKYYEQTFETICGKYKSLSVERLNSEHRRSLALLDSVLGTALDKSEILKVADDAYNKRIDELKPKPNANKVFLPECKLTVYAPFAIEGDLRIPAKKIVVTKNGVIKFIS